MTKSENWQELVKIFHYDKEEACKYLANQLRETADFLESLPANLEVLGCDCPLPGETLMSNFFVGTMGVMIVESNKESAERFDKTANILINLLKGDIKEDGFEATFPITTVQFRGLVDLLIENKINNNQVKQLYQHIKNTTQTPAEGMEQLKLGVTIDEEALKSIIQEVIAKNPKQAESYKNTKKLSGEDAKMIGFFMGQVMKVNRNFPAPRVKELLIEALNQ